jgi:hypothetical protein
MRTLLFIFILFGFIISGCTTIRNTVTDTDRPLPIVQTISEFDNEADQIELGDSKEKVLSILKPHLLPRQMNRPDQYIQDDLRIEIYYFKTGRQADSLRTDDEFTPYIFNTDQLIAIGWQYIGEATSHMKSTNTNVNVNQGSSSTSDSEKNILCRDALERGNEGGMQAHCYK